MKPSPMNIVFHDPKWVITIGMGKAAAFTEVPDARFMRYVLAGFISTMFIPAFPACGSSCSVPLEGVELSCGCCSVPAVFCTSCAQVGAATRKAPTTASSNEPSLTAMIADGNTSPHNIENLPYTAQMRRVTVTRNELGTGCRF